MQRAPAQANVSRGRWGDSGGKIASQRCDAWIAFRRRQQAGRAGARAGGRLARRAAEAECARRAKGAERHDAAERKGSLGRRCGAVVRGARGKGVGA